MNKVAFFIILLIVSFILLAWNDVKKRIFTKPEEVHLRPDFKLWLVIQPCCLFVGFLLFVVLQIVGIDAPLYRMFTCIPCLALSIFFGVYLTKRRLRRIFYETAIANRMDPEDYAKTLSPHFVVEYIETHLHDKQALEKQLKYYRSRHHISDACAWAFLVAYCDKKP